MILCLKDLFEIHFFCVGLSAKILLEKNVTSDLTLGNTVVFLQIKKILYIYKFLYVIFCVQSLSSFAGFCCFLCIRSPKSYYCKWIMKKFKNT